MEKAKILVVEDEDIMAEHIQMRLHSYGYVVPLVVATGEDAIKKVDEDNFDLVLMDIGLRGEMSGIDAAVRIRSRYDIPIIFLTSNIDEKIMERAKLTEPFGYLIKPIRERELHSTIKMALYKNRMEKKLRENEKELKRHRNHLQELVKEQTTELTKTNEQLQLEIAEHKQAEERKSQLLEEVERINQRLRDFVYIASHHLKSPLRGIGALANWISTDYTDKLDKVGKEHLELLVRRVDRMDAIIDGILYYLKVERIEKANVNINEIVTEVIDMIAPPEHIKITVKNELPSILCEKKHIIEVFQNLLSNAVNYMDKPEGIIKIDCVEDNGYWKFCVSDNGPGIEEKYFKKIFQIFQILSAIDGQENTGLGLALVKKTVTMYGGKVWVESEVGHGSTFFFTLPKEQKTIS